MTVEVDVNGRLRVVSVERTGRPGQFRVAVDGRARVVDVARSGDHALSILEKRTPSAENPEKGTVPLSRDVQVTPGAGRGELLVYLNGRTMGVRVNGRRTGHADSAFHGHGEVSIVSPMPGRVVRVLVGPGEEVGARQGVVVVEAMKMENELRAARDGRVVSVAVTEGQSVDAGAVLAVVE
jgi:biotin carboxyl carrier protein